MTSGPVKWALSLLLGLPVNHDPNDSTPLSEALILSAGRKKGEPLKFRTAQSAAQLDPPSLFVPDGRKPASRSESLASAPERRKAGAHTMRLSRVFVQKMRNAPNHPLS